MNLTQKNKNHTQNMNLNKISPNTQKQTKKKNTCTIKLQVNRLVKPELNKIPFNKNCKSLCIPSHYASQQTYDPKKSVEKQPQTKKKKIITKTFEELYFEKINQLRQQQNNHLYLENTHTPQISSINAQKVHPNSCKNVISIKNKSKIMTKQPQSTKNSTFEQNKENIHAQKSSENSFILTDNKFFRKINQTDHDKVLSNNVEFGNRRIQVNKNQFQKVKKVLKLKKVNIKSKGDDIFQYEKKESKEFLTIEEKEQCQKRLLSPLEVLSTTSQELKTFKLSTPLSSSDSQIYQLSSTSLLFQEITQSKIDHSQHEHIWGGVQCFFSFNQFKFILKQFGFDEQMNRELSLYVRKLWQHLGGELYGGVVKKNMIQFLDIVLQEQPHLNQDTKEINCQLLQNDFIQKSSLKLNLLNKHQKDQVRKFYFPLRMSKILQNIHNLPGKQNIMQNPTNSPNFSEELQIPNTQRKIQINVLETKETPDYKSIQMNESLHLQNNAYLDSISVKNRQQQMSPSMIQKTSDRTSHPTVITDFSPKLSEQQYEPFKSTILQRQSALDSQLFTQLSAQTKYPSVKPYRKALLSVDVNLGEGVLEKLVVYQDQDPYEVSLELQQRYNIEQELREKFELMLKNHLKNLLFKIEQVSQELFEDSVQLRHQQFERDFIFMERQL